MSLTFHQLRERSGLSPERLAERAGVPLDVVRALETNPSARTTPRSAMLVAGALGLMGPELDEFVASRRADRRRLADLFAAGSPDALPPEFGEQRALLRDLHMADYAVVGPHRRLLRSTVRRSFEVLAPGLDRFLWLRSFNAATMDPRRVRPIGLVNMGVGEVAYDESRSAIAVDSPLGRELAVGELCSVEYAIDFSESYLPDAADQPLTEHDTSSLLGVLHPMRSLFVEVRFDPADLPSRVWEIRRETFDGPNRISGDAPVSPYGVAQLFVEPAPSGIVGLSWSWDRPLGG